MTCAAAAALTASTAFFASFRAASHASRIDLRPTRCSSARRGAIARVTCSCTARRRCACDSSRFTAWRSPRGHVAAAAEAARSPHASDHRRSARRKAIALRSGSALSNRARAAFAASMASSHARQPISLRDTVQCARAARK
eukprot:2577232-Pleurochrysis_carterae.AAC.3